MRSRTPSAGSVNRAAAVSALASLFGAAACMTNPSAMQGCGLIQKGKDAGACLASVKNCGAAPLSAADAAKAATLEKAAESGKPGPFAAAMKQSGFDMSKTEQNKAQPKYAFARLAQNLAPTPENMQLLGRILGPAVGKVDSTGKFVFADGSGSIAAVPGAGGSGGTWKTTGGGETPVAGGAGGGSGGGTPSGTTPPVANGTCATSAQCTTGANLDLHLAEIKNNPPALADWPVTTKITKLTIGSNGFHLEFSKRDGAGSWPDITPPGWGGPLQYTLGMARYIDGKWYASAPVQFWRGLDSSGGPPSEVTKNWFYDAGRWGPLSKTQPGPGTYVGIFVVAGNVRNITDNGSQSPVKERSNVVMIPLPASGASYTFP
jgi:hypothetical protein